MSKLIQSLKKYTQPPTQTMGFQRNTVLEKNRPLLIIEISSDQSFFREQVSGADAILFNAPDIKSKTGLFNQLKVGQFEYPYGLRISDELHTSDLFKDSNQEPDFVVLSLDTPLITLPPTSGRIIEIESSLNDTFLRALDDLPLDAILLKDEPPTRVTWKMLNTIQRIDNLITRFILVKVSSEITSAELEMLWRTGMDGIVINIKGIPENRISQINNIITSGTFPVHRKVKKPDVILPFFSSGNSPSEDEEEGDEEEE